MTQRLRDIVEGAYGSTFVGLDTETTVKLVGGKKNEQYGRITKRSTGASVMVFQNRGKNGYENMVNRRLEDEGLPVDFTVGERPWGTRITGTPVVEHNGNDYLEVIYLHPPKNTYYLLDGKPIKECDIIGLPQKKVESKQGGQERKVIIRTFKEESIKKIRINKTIHDLSDTIGCSYTVPK